MKKLENGQTQMTINEAMVLSKVVKGRLGELSNLRSNVSTKERFFNSINQETRVVEPQYDIKLLDKKCVELENFLLEVDAAIKQSNAKTVINIEVDKTSLLSPLS